MADRTLTWSLADFKGNPTKMLPAYYMEADYAAVAVRIRAERAPDVADATFEIYDDGVSIMADNTYNYETYIANTAAYKGVYTIHLPKGDTVEEMAEDFGTTPIAAGSWVTCVMCTDGGAKDVTVQLDMVKLSDPDEEAD